jgi:putative FmdB family regulatory protein
MPIYVYKCPTCGNEEDVWKSRQEIHRREKCSKCTSVMDKLIAPVAFHLKGTGWYVTDYKETKKTNGK